MGASKIGKGKGNSGGKGEMMLSMWLGKASPRRHLRKDLKEVRERAMWISGGRKF